MELRFGRALISCCFFAHQNLEELFRDDSRNSTSLEIINVVFAGSLAFQCMDRITGEARVDGSQALMSLLSGDRQFVKPVSFARMANG